MSSEVVFFSSSRRSMRSTKAFNWSLAKRVAGCSFSAAAEAGIDVSLTTHGRRSLPFAKKLSELSDLRSRRGRRHPRCSQAGGDYEWRGLDFSNAAFWSAEASF